MHAWNKSLFFDVKKVAATRMGVGKIARITRAFWPFRTSLKSAHLRSPPYS